MEAVASKFKRTRIEKCTLGTRLHGMYDVYFFDYLDGNCWVNIGSSRNYDEALSRLTKWRKEQ